MSKAELELDNQIADIKRQLDTIHPTRRFWSWQFSYLPHLEKRKRELGY